MHIQIFSSQEVEVGGSRNLSQPGLDSELKNSLVYMVRPGLKITRRRDVAQWPSACLACGRPWIWGKVIIVCLLTRFLL